jgi:hypothetical protein
MRGIFVLTCLIGIAGIAGCTTPPPSQVADPPKITLTDALIDVIVSLQSAKATAQEYSERIGFNPCSATVVFNVAAKATTGNKFTLGVTAGPPVIPVGVSAGAEASQGAEANRGNQVTVVLTSAACIPDKTLGATHPDKIKEAQDQINQATPESPMFTGSLSRVVEERRSLQLEEVPLE